MKQFYFFLTISVLSSAADFTGILAGRIYIFFFMLTIITAGSLSRHCLCLQVSILLAAFSAAGRILYLKNTLLPEDYLAWAGIITTGFFADRIMCRFRNSEKTLQAKAELTEQMLERAERFSMLGQFAAGITHEICQPLNSIKIIAEGALLMNTRSGLALPEACEAFRKISARTESMEKIITNIRTLLAAQPEPDAVSDLNKCVQLFTEYSEKNFKEKGVNIYLIPCSENIVVYGSEIKIFCLLRNFTDNSLRAVKNSNLKAIYIKTGIKKDGPDAGKSFLTIEDTGCGIPESELESVFNPLRNIAGRTGLGLGLFIVRSICDSIHASIKAGNRTRGGAIFTVVFSSPGSLS